MQQPSDVSFTCFRAVTRIACRFRKVTETGSAKLLRDVFTVKEHHRVNKGNIQSNAFTCFSVFSGFANTPNDSVLGRIDNEFLRAVIDSNLDLDAVALRSAKLFRDAERNSLVHRDVPARGRQLATGHELRIDGSPLRHPYVVAAWGRPIVIVLRKVELYLCTRDMTNHGNHVLAAT